MAVIFAELGRFVRLCVPRWKYFQPRIRRIPRTRCRLLVAPLLIVLGFVQVAWMFLALQDGMMAVSRPDRARRVFDGGVKLDFDTPVRLVSTTNTRSPNYEHRKCNQTTCMGRHAGKPDGKENATDPKAIRKTLKGIIPSKDNISSILTSRLKTPAYFPWCSGRSAMSSQLNGVTGVQPNTTRHKYFLTAVLLVRIYAYDPAKLTTREMMQWMQYLNYAGVEHVYVYDAYLYKNESQRDELECLIKNGYVTYVDWSHKARPKYTIAGTQIAAYQKCLDKYGAEFAWQTAIDIDEYPYCTLDHKPGFLARAVRNVAETKPNVGEISMHNYLYLGKPLNHTSHPLLINRLWRRTTKRANALVKPIYQPKGIAAANVHHNALRRGFVNFTPKAEWLRMSHFWGARLQNWGEDTPKVLNMTMEDRGMEMAISALKPCLEGCEMGCC